MKICWDNLECLRYSKKTDKWYKGNTTYIYKDSCLTCGNDFLANSRIDGYYCSVGCKNKHIPPNNKGKNNPMYSKCHTDETKEKISTNRKGILKGDSNPAKRPEIRELISKRLKEINVPRNGISNGMYGKNHTKESKNKISVSLKELYKNNWKKYYRENNLPIYDTYASQIEWCEKVRRNKDDKNILDVKCTYCGKWFIPSISSINNRVQILKESEYFKGEYRLYCSEGCKQECSIYKKSPEQLMKEDRVRAGKINWTELNREVQAELRQMVFERDDYTCQKCNKKGGALNCHHIEGIRWEPLESADIDNCMTVCKKCHIKVHQIPGCSYNDMKCDEYRKEVILL